MPVTLDPDAAAVLAAFRAAGRPPYETLTPPQAREMYLAGCAASQPEPPKLASVEQIAIPGPGGELAARVYKPLSLRQSDGLLPCLVFFHGGGWVIGNLDTHDGVCRMIADEGQLIVIAIDYRLSPEHKFPSAVDDVIAATDWISKHARSLGVDAAQLFVGGDSAGGNLAAVAAIHARDSGPKLAGQVLIYPATDFAMTHPSHSEPETDALLTHSVVRYFRDQYVSASFDADHWRASPARVDTFADLPPAFVMTAGADPLRDEGDDYARRLGDAGVPVRHRTYPGQFHGFITMGKLLPKANDALREIGAWLRAVK